MKFVILHGTGASHNDNWFPWLKSQLLEQGHEVWVPDLPQADTPSAQRWTEFLVNSNYDFNDAVLIGHSAGAVEVMALLAATDFRLQAAILVGVFKGDLGWPELKDMAVEIDYADASQKAKSWTVIHSDDDPHCPLQDAQDIARDLQARFILMPGMNHFSVIIDPRFVIFPEILPVIQEVI